jgi:hypothetical protein
MIAKTVLLNYFVICLLKGYGSAKWEARKGFISDGFEKNLNKKTLQPGKKELVLKFTMETSLWKLEKNVRFKLKFQKHRINALG